jgi:hypothetical protein
VCFWQDTPDGEGNDEPLREAQETYARVGACSARWVDAVRKPTAGEAPPQGWLTIAEKCRAAREALPAMIERAFADVQHSVARGDSVSSAFYSVDELPLVLRDLAAVGDSAGDVGGVMLRYAAEFEEDVRRDGEGIGKSLEPFLVVLLGALIGVVMVALYLPIFKLAAVVK